jgi:arylsulfatase A-like enzyme
VTSAIRRHVALVVVLVAAAAAGAVVWFRGRSPPPPRGPDVLLLVMDTARADRCSLYGHWRETTPCLARLAEESIVFEDAWTPAPWTVPAHGALFTGRPPWEIGLLSRDAPIVAKGTPMLASLLSGAGRATLCVTANPWITKDFGLVTGFDEVVATYERGVSGRTPENHMRALQWMRERRAAKKPFFAFVNDMDPHAPYAPEGEFASKFVPSDLAFEKVQEGRAMTSQRGFALSLGFEPLDPEFRRAIGALYDGEMGALDAEIGHLVESMRAEGLLDDTLVVVVGDHGEGLADHGWIEHSFRVDREVLRVPLLVRLPGGARGGTRVREVVELQDVFTTVLEACGVPAPPEVKARSLLAPAAGRVAVAQGVATRELREAAAMGTSQDAVKPLNRLRGSAFDGRLHLVTEEGGGPRLFDVTADPGEQRDLAPERPADVQRLSGALPR